MELPVKKISISISVLLMVLCPCFSFTQASFTSKISPGSIGKNETAELRLMIDNARRIDKIIPPSLKDFVIIAGPNQESGMESNNGVTRQYIGITYILKPRSKGIFTIEPAIAKADGKTLRSNSVRLAVTNNKAGGNNNNNPIPGLSPYYDPVVPSDNADYVLKKGENVLDKINKNIFIRVDVNKNTCFVGEPLIVIYKLYTRLKSESSIIKNPAFNGFSVIDLMPPGNTYHEVEKLNGREYNVYTLRKSQLYPLQTGLIELEVAEVENNIHFIKEEFLNRERNSIDEMFRDFTQTTISADAMHDEKVTLRSKPVFITVKPLPEHKDSGVFNGAVGNFTIGSALEKTALTTDDAGKLKILISGEGNMTMINAPELQWPVGIEGFEPAVKEQLNKYAVPVSGLKVFEYPFTVTKAGSYTVPAVNFSYFDVKQNAFKTVSTKPFDIKVAGGSGKKPAFAKNIAGNNKPVFLDIIFTNRWLIILPLALFLITGLFVWLRKEDKKEANLVRDKQIIPDTKAVELTPPLDLNPLTLTEGKLINQDHTGFYQVLNKDFRVFLADKLQLPVETINRKKIAEEADKKGVPVDTCIKIQQLLDDIEWQLYTPSPDTEKVQEMYDVADELVHALNATVR